MVNISSKELFVSLLSNISIALIASIVGRGTSFLLFAIVARGVSASDAGIYALAMNYLALFLPISSLGLNDAAARDVAKDRDSARAYLVNLGFLRLVSGFICYSLLALTSVGIFDYPVDTAWVILLVGLSIIPDGLTQLFQAMFTAFEQQTYNVIVTVVISVTNLGLTGLALYAGESVALLAWVRLTCACLGFFTSFILIHKLMPGYRLQKPDLTWIGARLRIYFPFTMMVIFHTVEWRGDLLILSASRTECEIAGYYAAHALLMALMLLLDAYSLAILPPMSRLLQNDSKYLGHLHDRSFWYLSILVIPMAVGVSLMAKDILSTFNPGFTPASGALAILMLAGVISFLNEPNSRIMVAAGYQSATAVLLGISMVMNVVANLILAPRLGGLGSAIARVLSVTTFSVPNAILVSYLIRSYNPLQKLFPVLLAAGCMAIAICVLKYFLPWYLAGLMSIGVYISMLVVFNGVPTDDYKFMANILRHRG